jgi:hypothetical protein
VLHKFGTGLQEGTEGLFEGQLPCNFCEFQTLQKSTHFNLNKRHTRYALKNGYCSHIPEIILE